MNYALYQKRSNHQLSLRSRIGSNTGLYRGTTGLILFLRRILRINCYYSEKAVIFVRLLPLLSPFRGGRGRLQTEKLFKLNRFFTLQEPLFFPLWRKPQRQGGDDKCSIVYAPTGLFGNTKISTNWQRSKR